jgi:hypothetical protein
MAISLISQDSRQRRFACTGGETVLPVTFPFFAAADLAVLRNRAGVTVTLTLGPDYSVSGAGNPAGGSVTLAVPAEAGDLVVILSAQPDARTSDWTDGQALTAAALNAEFARKWIGVQQLRRDIDRAVRLPAIDPPGGLELPDAATRAGRFLGFDGSGAAVAMGAPDAPLGAVARSGDTMTGDLAISRNAATLGLNSATPTARALRWRTNGLSRWALLAWNDAESGGNVGSTLYLQRHDDAGTFTGNVFRVDRDTGRFVFMGGVLPRVPALDPTDVNDVARKAYVDANTAWVKIADVAITNVAQIDVTWTSGAYRMVRAAMLSWLPQVPASGTAILRVRADGSWISGPTSYALQFLAHEGATFGTAATSASACSLQDATHNAAGNPASCWIDVDPGPGIAGGEAGLQVHTRWSGPGARRVFSGMCGVAIGTATVDGLRFLMSGTNFAAQGRLLVMGVKA